MSKSRNYNPRINNNSSKKKVESEVQLDEQLVKQTSIEENQPDVEQEELFVEDTIKEEVIEEKQVELEEKQTKQNLPLQDEWLNKVIEEEKNIPSPVVKKIENVEKKEEIKKIPHYVFKRNEENRQIERVENISSEVEEKMSGITDVKLSILKALLEELERSIPRMELEVAIQEEIVIIEKSPDRLKIAQTKCDTLRDNLENTKLRKQAIEKLISKFKDLI